MKETEHECWNTEMPKSTDFGGEELLILYWDPHNGEYVVRNDDEYLFQSVINSTKQNALKFECWKKYRARRIHLPAKTKGHETYIDLAWVQGKEK